MISTSRPCTLSNLPSTTCDVPGTRAMYSSESDICAPGGGSALGVGAAAAPIPMTPDRTAAATSTDRICTANLLRRFEGPTITDVSES